MNQRDLSEIKRRLNPEKKNPTVIRGCYVGPTGDVISSFKKNVGMMPQEENEKYMAIFRRSLSGTPGRNLMPIAFTNEQVAGGEEYRLLYQLRETALQEDALVDAFYGRIISWIQSQQTELSIEDMQKASNYLILLLHDGMDVRFRDNNGEVDHERSTTAFSYILCAVCPVKQTKSGLSYIAADSEFHSKESDWMVTAPDMGLLFPAFEEGGANVYGAQFYTRDAADPHEAFLRSVLGTEPVMPAQEQQETLNSILQDALEADCSMEVIQAVHEQVGEMIKEQKADKQAEPLHLTKQDVSKVLQDCGVSQEHAEAFEEQYDALFGEEAALPAVNVLTPNEYKITTPSVTVKTDPEHSSLVQTRVIDGQCYVMILVDGDVLVNGVKVQL